MIFNFFYRTALMSLLAVKSYIWSKTFLFPMIVHDHEDHPPMVPIAAVAIYDEPPPFSMDKRKFRKKKRMDKTQCVQQIE